MAGLAKSVKLETSEHSKKQMNGRACFVAKLCTLLGGAHNVPMASRTKINVGLSLNLHLTVNGEKKTVDDLDT